MAPKRKASKKRKSVKELNNQTLHKLYYDPKQPGSYGGVEQLFRAAKQVLPAIKREQVEEWLSEQDTYTLHKPVRYTFPRKQVIVGGIDHQWQADLADVSQLKRDNDGFCFLLTVIDVFSKYAWVVPLKRKTQQAVTEAFISIFKEGRKPQTLQTDQGTEFLNDNVQKLLKKEGIHFFTTYNVETKASVVERFNRTLKSRMWRYFTEHQTRRYLDVLPQLVHAYNNTYHRSIGRSPTEVNQTNEETVWQRLYAPKQKSKKQVATLLKTVKQPKVKAGDWIRLSKARRTFKKGYLPNWSEELFSVVRIKDGNPPLYIVQDYHGEIIKGGMYAQEVQKVKKSDELYRVEKILQTRKKKNGKGKEVKVRWLGYGPSFDSWVDEKDVLDYIRRSQK